MADFSIKKVNDSERELLNVDALQTDRALVDSGHTELSLRLKDPSIYQSKNTESLSPLPKTTL